MVEEDFARQNTLDKELVYPRSAFANNKTKKGYSCCLVVIPFDEKGFDKESLEDERTRLLECRGVLLNDPNVHHEAGFEFDELIIEEEDYKQLIEKSNKLKIVYALENARARNGRVN